ncbi:MAG: imelysin family protein [Cyanobacteria bacterium J06636_16]
MAANAAEIPETLGIQQTNRHYPIHIALSEQSVLAGFVDQVILPTYDSLSQDTAFLADVTAALAANLTAGNLFKAQLAWRRSVLTWQQGTAYTFGPSDSFGFSGDLDSGLDEVGLINLLESDESLTAATISDFAASVRGFEAIAYLLFGPEGAQSADQLTERELTYLRLLTADLHTTAENLGTSWSGGVDGYPAYRQIFVSVGSPDNPAYLSSSAAFEEVIQGLLGTLDELYKEVLPDLMAAPDDMTDTSMGVSSLSSTYSVLEGTYYAYIGAVPEASGQRDGIADYVAASNPTVDAAIQQQFQIALSALEQARSDPATLTAASIALNTVMIRLEEDVLPLLQEQ